MVFSSMFFMCVFLPVVFILHCVLPGIRMKNALLLLASVFFYAYGEPVYIILLFISTLLNYFCARLIEGSRYKKGVLILAVICNLGILIVFKYTDFILGTVNGLLGLNLPLPQIRMPIGISFFTFQAMSYVIDVYRGTTKAQKNYAKVLLYISFFPQLIAGPIVKYHDVAWEIDHRTQSLDGIALGIRRFSAGLCKKVLISNTMGLVATSFLEHLPETLTQQGHGWERFPICCRFILTSADTAIWRSVWAGCSDSISKRTLIIRISVEASVISGEDGIFPCPDGFWNIFIFPLAETEKGNSAQL